MMTPEEEQLSIAHHVASGIADMHHAGIAHNDLSTHQFSICRGNLQNFQLSFSQFHKDKQQRIDMSRRTTSHESSRTS
jgi:tRNA A-37 threonylcarbamoyl transferase component Bud32